MPESDTPLTVEKESIGPRLFKSAGIKKWHFCDEIKVEVQSADFAIMACWAGSPADLLLLLLLGVPLLRAAAVTRFNAPWLAPCTNRRAPVGAIMPRDNGKAPNLGHGARLETYIQIDCCGQCKMGLRGCSALCVRCWGIGQT